MCILYLNTGLRNNQELLFLKIGYFQELYFCSLFLSSYTPPLNSTSLTNHITLWFGSNHAKVFTALKEENASPHNSQ